jgi:hypothetical protein
VLAARDALTAAVFQEHSAMVMGSPVYSALALPQDFVDLDCGSYIFFRTNEKRMPK